MYKTVKQYSKVVDKQTLLELQSKAVKTTRLMNWVYTQFNGNKSYFLVQTKLPGYIKDKVIGKESLDRFGMQTRSCTVAINDAIGNLKTQWTGIFNQVKEVVNNKKKDNSFTEHEAHYIYTVLKYKELTHCVLNNWKFENFNYYSDKSRNFILSRPSLQYEDIDKVKLNKWIRKQVRNFKTVPKGYKTRQFTIPDTNHRENNYLFFEGLTPRKQPKIKLTDARKLKPNRLVLNNDRVEIHNLVEVKITKPETENIVGIDKGYRNMLATSSGNVYGEGFNELIAKQVDKYVIKNKKRQKLNALAKKYEEQGKIEKANNIRKNNLGEKKLSKTKRKKDETNKNFVNKGLNDFFFFEKPTEIVHEDLAKLSQNKESKFSKKLRNQLNHWLKGYLQERINFKATQNGSDLVAVNPAYTSQICNFCGGFGKRRGDIFTCGCTGEQHADINAARNILARKYDSEIGLYTKYTKVKDILLARISNKPSQLDESQSWTPKTLDIDVGESHRDSLTAHSLREQNSMITSNDIQCQIYLV
jgi:IS605 OrfB family transposase